MEQQKEKVQEQAVLLQDRYSAMLRQQQVQSETLLKQMQSQMESEIKMKNEVVRHQLRMLGEIQVQNPTEAININGIMEQLRNQSQEGLQKTNQM